MATGVPKAKREMAETFAVSVLSANRADIRTAISRFYERRGKVTPEDIMDYITFSVGRGSDIREMTLADMFGILVIPLGVGTATQLKNYMVKELSYFIEDELAKKQQAI